MKRIGIAGFTMIELLVVIAIIAILAAIIFPAASRAKDAAYRSSDMSHMNELRSALQLYRVDQGGYPPLLFTAVQQYSTPPNDVIPADQTLDYLFPKRVSDLATFQPANDRSATTDIFPALTVASCANPQPTGSQPCVVWPGDPVTSPATPAQNCESRAYGTDTAVTSDPANPKDTSALPIHFYKVDGYDVAPVRNPDGSIRYELHYALFWTGYGIGFNNGSASCVSGGLAGNAADNVNQLGYANPPDTTVITWNTFFRDYDSSNNPVTDKRDMVLFLGGNAKMYSSVQVNSNPWSIAP